MKYLLLTTVLLTACLATEPVSCPGAAENYYAVCYTGDTFAVADHVYAYCVTSSKQACPELYSEWLECLAGIEERADCDHCFGSQWTCNSGASGVALDLCEYRVACLGAEYDADACHADTEAWGADAVYPCLCYSPVGTGDQWDQADCDEVAACLEEL